MIDAVILIIDCGVKSFMLLDIMKKIKILKWYIKLYFLLSNLLSLL